MAVTDAQAHWLIDRMFRKESDFVEDALLYLRKSRSLFDRFFARDNKFKPVIHAEAVRLRQFSILQALNRTRAENSEKKTVENVLNSLYGVSIAEASQGLPDYFDQEKAPGYVFAQNVWEQVRARRDLEIFMAFTLHVNRMLASLIDLFADGIKGLTEDPNGFFHGYVEVMVERYKQQGLTPPPILSE